MSDLVLSIDQPYASLVLAGVKRFETRPSPPNGDMRPDGVRGLPGAAINQGDRLLIASTQRLQQWSDGTLGVHNGSLWAGTAVDDADEVSDLPLGYILGSVTVADVVPIDANAYCERDAAERHVCIYGDDVLTLVDHELGDLPISDQFPFGDWQRGRWAWELTDPRPFDVPVPVVGKQGVWRWDGSVRS